MGIFWQINIFLMYGILKTKILLAAESAWIYFFLLIFWMQKKLHPEMEVYIKKIYLIKMGVSEQKFFYQPHRPSLTLFLLMFSMWKNFAQGWEFLYRRYISYNGRLATKIDLPAKSAWLHSFSVVILDVKNFQPGMGVSPQINIFKIHGSLATKIVPPIAGLTALFICCRFRYEKNCNQGWEFLYR